MALTQTWMPTTDVLSIDALRERLRLLMQPHYFKSIPDDLSEYALKFGGDVIIVPTERMPTRAGATAIYRF